ncbi:MAG: hypothetical protein H8E85_06930 [Candidatus Marinimicrobia bacterium]|nr:hypothetical protein [Candidatus Neomarinimicrobiota bacterium]
MGKILFFLSPFSFLLFSLSFLLSSPHPYPPSWNDLQNDLEWKLVKETDRVLVYSKILPDSPIPALKAEILSDVKMEKLADAAWLVEKSTDIFPNAFIIDAGVYHRRSETSYTAYQVFDVPFLSPRLYQFNSIRVGNSIHWVRTDTVNIKWNPDGYLLPPVNFGSWVVTQEGNKSKLTYRVCTDPGGDVPHWIVNQANQRYLPQMLEDIESFAGKKEIP